MSRRDSYFVYIVSYKKHIKSSSHLDQKTQKTLLAVSCGSMNLIKMSSDSYVNVSFQKLYWQNESERHLNFRFIINRNFLFPQKLIWIWYMVSYRGNITLKIDENVFFSSSYSCFNICESRCLWSGGKRLMN